MRYFESAHEVEADIERMLAIRRNRRELGWSYWGIPIGGGHQIGVHPMSAAERARRHRAGEATPRRKRAAA